MIYNQVVSIGLKKPEVAMKTWQATIICLLLVSLPLLASCDVLGIGGKSKEQQYYEQQLQQMQLQAAAEQAAQQQYYEQLQKALQEYLNQYASYTQAQKEAEIKAVQDAANAAKQAEIPYN
jgi:hypothetical protein